MFIGRVSVKDVDPVVADANAPWSIGKRGKVMEVSSHPFDPNKQTVMLLRSFNFALDISPDDARELAIILNQAADFAEDK